MDGAGAGPPLPVGEVVRLIGQHLRREPLLRQIAVTGELDRLTVSQARHWYFALRDAEGRLECVAFAGVVAGFRGRPEPGEDLVAIGEVDVYAPQGRLQLRVKRLLRGTVGEREAERQWLLERLRAEGVLDRARLPLPSPPRHVGIITGAASAALADLLRQREVRWPGLRTTIVTSLVQGEQATDQIVRALGVMATVADPARATERGEPPIDVVLLARGGGSQDDLWVFNLEPVARAVAAMPVPVISAIGHESDLLVSDLVADQRAATPTQAAALAIPLVRQLELIALDARERLGSAASRRIARAREQQEGLLRRLALAPTVGVERGRARLAMLKQRLTERTAAHLTAQWRHLEQVGSRLHSGLASRLIRQHRHLGSARHALERAGERHLAGIRARLASLHVTLEVIDPRQVLARGFSLIADASGRPIGSATAASAAGRLDLTFHDGHIAADVVQ